MDVIQEKATSFTSYLWVVHTKQPVIMPILSDFDILSWPFTARHTSYPLESGKDTQEFKMQAM